MKKNYLLLFSMVLLASFGWGQVIIHNESFESAPNGSGTDYSIDTEFGGSDVNDYFQRILISGNGKDEIDSGVTGGDGSYMIAGEDIDGGSPTPKVITIVDVSTIGYNDIIISGLFGSGEQNKYDSGDYIKLYVKKDGGSSELIAAFYGYDHINHDGTNGRMYEDENLDGSTSDNSDNILSKTFTEYSYSLSGSFSSVQVIVELTTNSGDEVLMLDDITIKGTASSSGPQDPTDFTIDNTTSSQIGLSWTNPANSDGVWVVAREGAAPDVDITDGEGVYDYDGVSSSGNFSTATDLVDDKGYTGTSGNILVYSGTGTSCIVTGLTEGNDYYFTIFNEYGTADWSDGAQSTPTNDVAEVQGTSSFAAAAGNAQASLSWSNPSGQGTYWDNVLILAKSGGAVDATPSGAGSGYTANAIFGLGDEIGTGNYVVYKGTGTSETVTALTNGTAYYFKTFVYDGSVWTSVGQTETGSCTPSNSKVETFDNSNATSSYNDDNFVGNNGITWNYVQSRDENGDANGSGIDGNALMLRRSSSSSSVYSESISGGIGNFSVKLYKGFTGGGTRQVELFVNGTSQGTSATFDDYNEHVFTVNDINITGNVVIRIDNLTSKQVIVDDITWSGYVGTPGLWKTDAASNDWATGSNWDDGNVPTAATNVIIPVGATNYPTITAGTSCNNLTIKSDATGDASLIGQGNLTVNGTTTVERYISPYSGSSDGWHFLSSPVNTMTIAGSDFVSGTYDLYYWAEDEASENRWYNYEGGSFPDASFENGTGYLFADAAGGVFEFSGDLNSSTVTKNLSYNADKGEGMNLIGNPFTSALDADAITFTGAVNTGVYVVNPADGSYMAHNGRFGHPALADGHIPVNQGFFVEATGAGASVSMETADQVHSTNDFNKNSQSMPNESMMVTLSGENSDSYTFLGFRNDASMAFDGNYDAYELFGWATMAQVYTELEDVQYSINCLPHSEETITVPLCISVQSDEQLSLNFSGMETFFNTVKIELEDKQLGFTQNIANNPTYTFEASAQDNPNRFLLHFNGVTGLEDVAHQNNIQVYSVDDMIYINSLEDLSADILVYNINGQLVYNGQMNGESLKRVSLGTSSGVYLVNIVSEETSSTHKVYVK